MSHVNVSLPHELKTFVDQQVAARGYGSTSEYLRDLIRQQRDIEQMRQLLFDGANSGPGQQIDDAWFAKLRKQASR